MSSPLTSRYLPLVVSKCLRLRGGIRIHWRGVRPWMGWIAISRPPFVMQQKVSWRDQISPASQGLRIKVPDSGSMVNHTPCKLKISVFGIHGWFIWFFYGFILDRSILNLTAAREVPRLLIQPQSDGYATPPDFYSFCKLPPRGQNY